MSLKWELIYSVNIKEIDKQHKKIFSIINRFFKIKKDYSKDQLTKIMKELQRYGNYHLATEEKYFKKFNYPDQIPHIIEHDKYREKVAKLAKDIQENKEVIVVAQLSDFLSHWWLHHIQETDIKYSAFFNENGLF